MSKEMREGMGHPGLSFGYLRGKKNALYLSLLSWYFCRIFVLFQNTHCQKMYEGLNDVNLRGCIKSLYIGKKNNTSSKFITDL